MGVRSFADCVAEPPRGRFMASRRLRGSSIIEAGFAAGRKGGGSVVLIVLRLRAAEGDEDFSRQTSIFIRSDARRFVAWAGVRSRIVEAPGLVLFADVGLLFQHGSQTRMAQCPKRATGARSYGARLLFACGWH